MALASRLPWLRILVEGLVIVTSILLALAADAWWDGLQDRRTEQLVLRGLKADFEATLEIIAAERLRLEERAQMAEELISFGGQRRVQISAARVDTLLASILPGNAFVPVEATLNALLSSDGLGVISNQDLRSQLAAWPGLVARVLRDEHQNEEAFLNQFLPYLHSRVPVRVLDAIGSPLSGVQVSAFSPDSRELLADLRFENHVNDILFYSRSKAANLSRAEEHVRETLTTISMVLQ